jgi:hypothetical protein
MDDHLVQLSDVLENGDRHRAEIERFLVDFLRPHGLDTPATPLVADAIEALESLPRRRPLSARLAFSGAAFARREQRA